MCVIKKPQRRRPRPELGRRAIGWMDCRLMWKKMGSSYRPIQSWGYVECTRAYPSHAVRVTEILITRLPLHCMFCLTYPRFAFWSRGSSGSIVSGYGLDDRAIEIRSSAGAKDFSSNLCVRTGSGAHPASCTMGTGGPFAGAKRSRGVTLTTHSHLVPRSWMSRSYTSSPPKCLHSV
jgi:hypothetical protein